MRPSTGTPAARPRTTAPLAYDPSTSQLVLFGGYYGGPIGTTWVLSGTAVWSQETPAKSPSARYGAAAAYDPTVGALVLFGGATGTASTATTWEWTGSTWVHESPAHSPPATDTSSLVADAHVTQLVLYDGATGSTWTWQAPTVSTAPGPPAHVVATPGTGQVTVSWTAGTAGSTATTGYLVTATPGGATCSTTGAAHLHRARAGERDAVHLLGDRPEPRWHIGALVGDAPGHPAGLPGVPPQWWPPWPSSARRRPQPAGRGTGNGAPILSYTVTASPGTAHCSSPDPSCQVHSLTLDVPYTFTVTATNRVGSGGASDPSSPLVLPGLPGAPVQCRGHRRRPAGHRGCDSPVHRRRRHHRVHGARAPRNTHL